MATQDTIDQPPAPIIIDYDEYVKDVAFEEGEELGHRFVERVAFAVIHQGSQVCGAAVAGADSARVVLPKGAISPRILRAASARGWTIATEVADDESVQVEFLSFELQFAWRGIPGERVGCSTYGVPSAGDSLHELHVHIGESGSTYFAMASLSRSKTAPEGIAMGLISHDEAKRLTYDFFDTMDRHDWEDFQNMYESSPEFALLEDGRVTSAETLINEWKKEDAVGAQASRRTCTDERIYRSSTLVVYIGNCVVDAPTLGTSNSVRRGWNTVVQIRDGNYWQVAWWQR